MILTHIQAYHLSIQIIEVMNRGDFKQGRLRHKNETSILQVLFLTEVIRAPAGHGAETFKPIDKHF
jgi:hypothetical protein